MHRRALALPWYIVVATLGVTACSGSTGPGGPGPIRLTPRLAAGAFFTCALDHTGTAFCWGDGTAGDLGNAMLGGSNVPVQVQGGPYVALAAGTDAACGLRSDGVAECWGLVPDKCCGQGSGNEFVPTPIATSTAFKEISVAGPSMCAIDPSGNGSCWGQGLKGALGNGQIFDTSDAPIVPLPGGHIFSTLGQGAFGGCGVDTGGSAWCWGTDLDGALGVGIDTDSVRASLPVEVNGGLKFRQIVAGAAYACGVTTTGQTECWGDNRAGQLGDGTATNRSVPTPVPGANFIAIYGGSPDYLLDHTCGLTADGFASCWGLNDRGQLGGTGTDGCGANTNSGPTCSTTPVAVAGSLKFIALALGDLHTCGMIPDGHVYCWGDNEGGQLGDGTTDGHTLPTRSLFKP